MLAKRKTRNGPVKATRWPRTYASDSSPGWRSSTRKLRISLPSIATKVSKAWRAKPRSDRSRRSTAVSPQVGQNAVAMSCLQLGQVQVAGSVTTNSPFGALAESLRCSTTTANRRRRLITAPRTLANRRIL